MPPRPLTSLTGLLASAALVLTLAPSGSAIPVDEPNADTGAVAATTVGVPPKPVRKPRVNPLAGRRWGTYKGPGDQAWKPYVRARGEDKRLLATIALTPKAKWFGAWIPDSQIERKARDYVANATGGDRRVMVQMTVFRMDPWEHEACRRLPSKREQASYRRWIDAFARGVGRAHAAIILQPDGPFALCVPHRSTLPSSLIAYSARVLSRLPNAVVYLDGGASDYPIGDEDAVVRFLVNGGVKYVRGIALDSTHYVSVASDIEHGAVLIRRLAKRGIRGKHLVINTSSNGKPFQFREARGNDRDNAGVCRSRSDRKCVTLGIRPTTKVALKKWGLTLEQRKLAYRYVDAYLWFGRPWLYRQNDPFDMKRALQLVRTTPYS